MTRDLRLRLKAARSACNALRRRHRPSRRRPEVRFSTKLWPLESEDEIVALLLGMARYPVDTPDRAELIAADMQTKHASTTINVLVSSIESEAGISALVDLLDRKRFHEQEKSTPLHLVPQIEFCAVCALQGAEGAPCVPSNRILHARALGRVPLLQALPKLPRQAQPLVC